MRNSYIGIAFYWLAITVGICGCNRDKPIKITVPITITHSQRSTPQSDIVAATADNLIDTGETTITAQPNSHGLVYDIQGNIYHTVAIGKQEWFAQNLKTEVFGSWCCFDDEKNCDTYGRLYCWYVAVDVCPNGWKLPSDEDWKVLEKHLGMDEEELNEEGLRGTIEGGLLKDTVMLWDQPNENASNNIGFNALPGGPRYKLGMYGLLGHNATFWTSTETDSSHAFFRYLGNSHARIGRIDNEKVEGHSVRCMRYIQ
jgi:uncharacterized protein (TIGR02145 family)